MVCWVDQEHQCCISISGSEHAEFPGDQVSLEDLIGYAKEIIDLNR